MMILLAIIGFLIPIFFGYAISRLFFRDLDFYERIISSVALGTGIFGLLFFLLNEFLSIKFSFVNAMIFMLFMFIVSIIILSIMYFKSLHLDGQKKNLSKRYSRCLNNIRDFLNNLFKTDALIKIFIIILLLLIFYKTLFFPIINGDGIGFHAPIIREIFQNGGMSHDVGPNTVEFTRAYPPLFFILGAWPSILNQGYEEFFIKLLPLFFGFLALVAVYALAKNIVFKDKRKALLACFMLMTFPMFVNYTVYLSNDTIFSFFAITAIYFTMKYLKEPKAIYLFLSFAIFGFSINVKQHGIPLFAGVFISLLLIIFYKDIIRSYSSLKSKGSLYKFLRTRNVKVFFISIIILLLIVSPFFIRNYLFFGDPIYPFLSGSEYFHGKNYYQFLYAPLGEMYKLTTLFSSPQHTLYGVVNYIRDPGYSMSLFFILLLFLTLLGFRKLRKEQKYLLYFSIIFTIYYIYAFLAKYRYYMAITALLCVVVASKLDDFLRFRLTKKERFFVILFIVAMLILLLLYVLVVIYKTYFISLLGAMSAHFLNDASVIIFIHLLVTVFALSSYLIFKNRTLKISLLIFLICIPSLYGIATINYGLIGDVTGAINTSKNMTMFWNQEFKFFPDYDAVLKMNFGDDYDTQKYIRDNTANTSRILAYGGLVYYSNRDVILIDSYKFVGTYNSTIQDSLKILKDQNMTYILYKKLGWDEYVYGIGVLYAQSAITQNINNSEFFEPVYQNSQFIVYKIKYA